MITLTDRVCLKLIKRAEQKIDRLDAEIMLSHLLGIRRTELYIYEDDINENIINRFDYYIKERLKGRPLQYIIGKTTFMGLEFIVNPSVFIPRPETELLVETTIETAKPMTYDPSPNTCLSILDLGTGSGNIAISLTKFITDCKILGSDVSPAAIFTARKNAQLHLVDKNCEFVLSNLFEGLQGLKFDIIVSNPPYIASLDIDGLSREIGFEPRLALDGGEDGFDFHRRIIRDAGRFLKKGGFLILELGFNQAEGVEAILNKNHFKNIIFLKDYNNIKRVAISKWTN